MIQKFRLCHGNNTKNKYKTFFFLIFYILNLWTQLVIIVWLFQNIFKLKVFNLFGENELLLVYFIVL